MAKKRGKSVEPTGPNPYLEKQVMEHDTLTIEDVKQFITDCKKNPDRQDWLNIAERSWGEIKKKNRKGRLYGGNDLDRARRWAKFPLWWSCWKIRQPLTLARLAIPVLKDTQGDDPFGRTACVLGERLIKGILKTFDAFDEFSASNDDFLVTDFGWGRAFYRKEECLEEEKVRLQEIQPPPPPQEMMPQGPQEEQAEPSQEAMPQEQQEPMQPPEPLPPIFVTPDGQQVMEPLFDEFGPYIKSGQQITVENEEVYFEAGLYSSLYVEDVKRWNKVTRLAFEYQYNYREFKEKFGQEALDKLARGDIEDHRAGKPIICFEYHDKYLKEVRWFAENSEDFFQPVEMRNATLDGLTEVGAPIDKSPKPDNSDIYGLSGFFPCTQPMVINAATDTFWPTAEYFQVCDILEDINNIVARMFLLTKAIRVRFFFDSSIPQLKQLIGETGEGGGLGIANLEQALMNGKGTLSTLVAYFPVEEMITGLNNMYAAFQQRLDMFKQATGINELLQGQTNNDIAKTYGERQLEGKFALNRIEPRQRKVQEWIKDNYKLLMEMALKNFSDKTLDEYITPQTLDPEDRERYVPALELLKANKRNRFRIDFETDSTIAINQQWKKQQAVELANTLTKAMESTAQVAESQPELAKTELAVLKHLIGEFSDGKLFVDEIQDSIQQVIDKVAQPKPPEPNVELQKLQLQGAISAEELKFKNAELQTSAQFEVLKIQANERIEMAKLQQSGAIESIKQQLEQFKVMSENQATGAEMQLKMQELSASIAESQQKLQLERDSLMIELRKIADKKEVDQFANMIDLRVAEYEKELGVAHQKLEEFRVQLDEKEKYMTEQRLQSEHELEKVHAALAIMQHKHETQAQVQAATKPAEPQAPPVINVHIPEQKTPVMKRISKVKRDKSGSIAEIEHIDTPEE